MVKETDRKNKELFLGVKIFYFCGSKLANLEARKKLRANTKTSEGIFAEDIKRDREKAPLSLSVEDVWHISAETDEPHITTTEYLVMAHAPQTYEKHRRPRRTKSGL